LKRRFWRRLRLDTHREYGISLIKLESEVFAFEVETTGRLGKDAWLF